MLTFSQSWRHRDVTSGSHTDSTNSPSSFGDPVLDDFWKLAEHRFHFAADIVTMTYYAVSFTPWLLKQEMRSHTARSQMGICFTQAHIIGPNLGVFPWSLDVCDVGRRIFQITSSSHPITPHGLNLQKLQLNTGVYFMI